jgi:hypothetical protein
MKNDNSIHINGDVKGSNVVSGNSTNSFQSTSQQVNDDGNKVISGGYETRKSNYFIVGISLLLTLALGGIGLSFVMGINKDGQLSPNPPKQQLKP